jgi:hypothetical protein
MESSLWNWQLKNNAVLSVIPSCVNKMLLNSIIQSKIHSINHAHTNIHVTIRRIPYFIIIFSELATKHAKLRLLVLPHLIVGPSKSNNSRITEHVFMKSDIGVSIKFVQTLKF